MTASAPSPVPGPGGSPGSADRTPRPRSASSAGPAARRVRQREETRQRILDAARDLFVEKGVEATTMRAIAAQIDYTPTAIYHHFRDKDALLEELCYLDFRALASALTKIGAIADPIERIRRMGIAYAEFGLTNVSQYRFMFMAHSRHSISEARVADKDNPEVDAYAFLVQTVEEGMQKRLFRSGLGDAHQLAQLLWAGLHGVIALHIAKRHDPWIEWRDPLATIRIAIDVMIRGTTNPEPS